MNGKLLRHRREQIGLSQAALAQEIGVSANTVARWERDELTIGSPKMLNLALNSLQTAGLRNSLADVEKKLPRMKVAFPDANRDKRIRLASQQLQAWIHKTLVLPDPELRKAVCSKASFPGYRVLSHMGTDAKLNISTRAELNWAIHSTFRALEIAQRIWSFTWLDVTTNSVAKRKRQNANV